MKKKSTMKHKEAKETPKMEAQYHSRGFLKKAVALSKQQVKRIRSAAGAAY